SCNTTQRHTNSPPSTPTHTSQHTCGSSVTQHRDRQPARPATQKRRGRHNTHTQQHTHTQHKHTTTTHTQQHTQQYKHTMTHTHNNTHTQHTISQRARERYREERESDGEIQRGERERWRQRAMERYREERESDGEIQRGDR